MSKPSLTLKITEISDPIIRENFSNLLGYLKKFNQMVNFIHLEFKVEGAETNKKIAHNLGFKPKDIVRTKVVGTGKVTFNHSLFTDQFLDINTTGPVRVRAFVGTFIDDSSSESEDSSDVEDMKATI